MSSMKDPRIITCKAAVAWEAGQPLVMEEVEVDPPKPMEIRIKVVCTSICRSDITLWESKAHAHLFPRIFGHEASGIVESIGEGVTEFVEGDHVLTLFTGECMSCKHCISGKSNMCQTLGMERNGVMHSDKTTRFSIKGKPVYHHCAVSSFSEYTVVHSGCAVKICSTVPMEKICVLSCGAAAGLGAAWKVADVSKGSTVVIFGLGTVGLSVAQGAKLRGASRIIGLDTNPAKYEKGKAFGVTEFINPDECSEPIHQVLKNVTGGGADYCFECIGDTGMITAALQSCCDGWGLTVTLGVPKVKPEFSAHYALLLGGRTLKGSLYGGWKPKSEIPSLVDMYTRKEILIDELITHNLPIEEINKAFDLMREGKCLRCVLHMPK
ncbi:alcohol dehydrogenase-like 6 [Magnolia sinica]|uniref:alcohol dehydrogenase-like 6 n=1 Tax=Magnolia sinica TaxID=86752 RepID=UPI00265AB247|nr:alcohol dehydrogenase-like 6 [Magnolia sinica]